MFAAIKKFYSKPFLQETRSLFAIILYRLFLAVVWPIYWAKYRRVLRHTRAFIRETSTDIRKRGKSAFVFANGPSLRDIDLAKIRALCQTGKYDLISVNSYASKSAETAPPRFAVFADNVHFAGGDTQYSRDLETCERLGITYFAPAKYIDGKSPLRMGFCSLSNIDAANTSDITRPAGYYGVTAFFALSLAKMLGYKKIYICGYDNSYFRDFEVGDDGKMFIRHKHYYDDDAADTLVPCLYRSSSEFFFDTYRHFSFLAKIARDDSSIVNVAKRTYLSDISMDRSLDIYKGTKDSDTTSNELSPGFKPC
ncbi:hypothetical protein B6V73_16550 [Thioclava sp. JM3]|uniref:hypothetical protein n=1 Tax=Thioclava sp. JM3 TaxID=1973004 RepID=UPI000B546AF2|nr:hypothetical protein [Thioclava sp. JM3]OWY14206.1 hypothetical protein B6V73_16550 [Thioclava sp. JM3]